MAVDATSKIQNANYLQKPSRMAFESNVGYTVTPSQSESQ